MTTTLQEPPLTQVDEIELSDVIQPSRVYTHEDVLRKIEGIDANWLRQHFGGVAHTRGSDLLEYQRTCIPSGRLRVNKTLAARILKARGMVKRSTAADVVRTLDSEPNADDPPPTATDDNDVTLETLFRPNRFYLLEDLRQMLANFDAAVRAAFANRPSILGGELLDFGRVRAREGKPLLIRPEVVSKILHDREQASQAKAAHEAAVRSGAKTLLVEIRRLRVLAGELGARRAVASEVRSEYERQRQAKLKTILAELTEAEQRERQAAFAADAVEPTERKLRKMALRNPSLFKTRGNLPELIEPEIEAVVEQ